MAQVKVTVTTASIPAAARPRYEEIVTECETFCRAHLNEEYLELCRRMAATLARKRPSPILSGPVRSWACGIVYVLGQLNFLFDKSQTPHMRANELCAGFGVAASTGGNKANQIRTLLKIRPYDPDWCLPGRLADHPLAWKISVNGFIMDARQAPREIQEEALRLGLIPFLPEPVEER